MWLGPYSGAHEMRQKLILLNGLVTSLDDWIVVANSGEPAVGKRATSRTLASYRDSCSSRMAASALHLHRALAAAVRLLSAQNLSHLWVLPPRPTPASLCTMICPADEFQSYGEYSIPQHLAAADAVGATYVWGILRDR